MDQGGPGGLDPRLGSPASRAVPMYSLDQRPSANGNASMMGFQRPQPQQPNSIHQRSKQQQHSVKTTFVRVKSYNKTAVHQRHTGAPRSDNPTSYREAGLAVLPGNQHLDVSTKDPLTASPSAYKLAGKPWPYVSNATQAGAPASTGGAQFRASALGRYPHPQDTTVVDWISPAPTMRRKQGKKGQGSPAQSGNWSAAEATPRSAASSIRGSRDPRAGSPSGQQSSPSYPSQRPIGSAAAPVQHWPELNVSTIGQSREKPQAAEYPANAASGDPGAAPRGRDEERTHGDGAMSFDPQLRPFTAPESPRGITRTSSNGSDNFPPPKTRNTSTSHGTRQTGAAANAKHSRTASHTSNRRGGPKNSQMGVWDQPWEATGWDSGAGIDGEDQALHLAGYVDEFCEHFPSAPHAPEAPSSSMSSTEDGQDVEDEYRGAANVQGDEIPEEIDANGALGDGGNADKRGRDKAEEAAVEVEEEVEAEEAGVLAAADSELVPEAENPDPQDGIDGSMDHTGSDGVETKSSGRFGAMAVEISDAAGQPPSDSDSEREECNSEMSTPISTPTYTPVSTPATSPSKSPSKLRRQAFATTRALSLPKTVDLAEALPPAKEPSWKVFSKVVETHAAEAEADMEEHFPDAPGGHQQGMDLGDSDVDDDAIHFGDRLASAIINMFPATSPQGSRQTPISPKNISAGSWFDKSSDLVPAPPTVLSRKVVYSHHGRRVMTSPTKQRPPLGISVSKARASAQASPQAPQQQSPWRSYIAKDLPQEYNDATEAISPVMRAAAAAPNSRGGLRGYGIRASKPISARKQTADAQRRGKSQMAGYFKLPDQSAWRRGPRGNSAPVANVAGRRAVAQSGLADCVWSTGGGPSMQQEGQLSISTDRRPRGEDSSSAFVIATFRGTAAQQQGYSGGQSREVRGDRTKDAHSGSDVATEKQRDPATGSFSSKPVEGGSPFDGASGAAAAPTRQQQMQPRPALAVGDWSGWEPPVPALQQRPMLMRSRTANAKMNSQMQRTPVNYTRPPSISTHTPVRPGGHDLLTS